MHTGQVTTVPLKQTATTPTSSDALLDEPTPEPSDTCASIQCSVVHATAGRLRMRVEPGEILERLGGALEALLRQHPGVTDVRLSPTTRSVVLEFDPTATTVDALLGIAGHLPVAELETHGPRGATADAMETDASSWLYLGLSSAALALDLVFPSGLAPWLLAGAAAPIFVRAFESLSEKRRLNVDVLDAAATVVLVTQAHIRTAGIMVWLVSLGDVIRDLTLRKSHGAIEDLFTANIQHAWVVRGDTKVRVRVEEIAEGDEVVVYPGELITVDGIVVKGRATVDQKVLTGESVPVEKSEGDTVYAATVVREGKLYLKASKIGQETMVANVVHLIRDTPARETRAQNYAEHFADRVVPWSFLGAGAALLATGNVNSAAALLIIDYGTGIRVAAPTAVLAAMTTAARQGILIKGGRHLEDLATIDTIVFDKTGTLTLGHPEVVEIIPYGKVAPDWLLARAAAAEQRLTHPMAEAIVRAAVERGLEIPERDASEYTIGLGVEATVDRHTLQIGCHRFMTSKDVALRRARFDLARINDVAASPIFVAIDGELAGIMVCSDPLRPEAAGVVRALRARGVREVIMLTGDHPAVARTVAEHLGITRYVADALPEQKSDYVRTLQQNGAKVAVVGDGINDSPALARADVGIAVRGGTDVARETAHVAVLEGTLWKIPQAIDIARQATGLIGQNWNLIWYPNTAAIALSLAGVLGPVGATLLSNGASILATLNSLRPLLGTGGDESDERGEESLERSFGGRPQEQGTEPVSQPARHLRDGFRVPEVAPAP